ncbi:MAG: hypothetical protein Tsb002_28510 [Wenzhouxiangellaceae bacterium]
MTTRILSWSWLLIAASMMLACRAVAETPSDPVWDEHVLILARPGSAELLGDLQPAASGDVPVGQRFRLRLSDIEVLEGKLQPAVSEVEVSASHAQALTQADQISLLLKRNAEGGYQVLHWNEPIRVTCLPDALLRQEGLDGEFPFHQQRWRQSCAVTDWQQ